MSDLFGHEPPPEYPNAPGHRGVETSIEAGEAVAPKLGRLQAMAERSIRDAGSLGRTADELAECLGLDRWSVQPRTSELKRLGKIVDSGLRRFNSSGKRAIVWTMPEYKRDAA